jgi:hypothetical protein
VAVEKRYYSRMLNGTVNAFVIDMSVACDQAYAASDIEGHDALNRVWLDYFEKYLGNMKGPELVKYLQGRQVWQREGDWLVFATIDEPCLAYTAQQGPGDAVALIALGVCYRYPAGGRNGWWRDVIQPRVRTL